jgi:hypothetical protein
MIVVWFEYGLHIHTWMKLLSMHRRYPMCSHSKPGMIFRLSKNLTRTGHHRYGMTSRVLGFCQGLYRIVTLNATGHRSEGCTLEEYYPFEEIIQDTNADGTTLLNAAVQLAHIEIVKIPSLPRSEGVLKR